MKVIPNFNKGLTLEGKIGIYIWQMARNLLQAKRNLRIITKNNPPIWVLEFAKGVENEAHNNYFGAKEYFGDILDKK